MRRRLGLLVLLVVPTLALAQPVMNPSRVVFTPSTDHANPAVTGYEFGYFAVAAPDPIVKTLITKAQLVAQGTDFDFAFPRLAFGVGFEHRLRMCADGWVGFGGTVCSLWVTADRLSTVSPLAAASVRLTP